MMAGFERLHHILRLSIHSKCHNYENCTGGNTAVGKKKRSNLRAACIVFYKNVFDVLSFAVAVNCTSPSSKSY